MVFLALIAIISCGAETFHLDSGTLVAHVHVPKTGGDAFYAVFRGFFPLQLPADRSSHQYPGCARGNQVTTLHSYRSEIGDCVLRKRAKFTPGVATHRKVEKVKFILGVRNPVERVLSEYYWNVRIRRGEIGNNPKEMPAERIWPQELHDVEDDLLKWVTSPYNVAHNRVAKQIGGNVTFGETPKEFTMTLNMTEYREYWRSLAGTHLANGDAIEAALNDLEGGGGALLAAAQAAITHEFLAVVVMEQLNDAARRFASLREVPGTALEPVLERATMRRAHATRRPSTQTLPTVVIEEIRARNAVDIALYEWITRAAVDGLYLPSIPEEEVNLPFGYYNPVPPDLSAGKGGGKKGKKVGKMKGGIPMKGAFDGGAPLKGKKKGGPLKGKKGPNGYKAGKRPPAQEL
jgi:hypothetical protein